MKKETKGQKDLLFASILNLAIDCTPYGDEEIAASATISSFGSLFMGLL
jgi:hypothetical protein